MDGARFCEQDAPFPLFEIDRKPFFRCPVQEITGQSREALSLYVFYQRGHLPTAGGIMDQPNKMMDQIRIIENVVEEVRRERRAQSAKR